MPTRYSGSAEERAALDAYIKLWRAAHAVEVAGIDHVGLGSDFDGAVTTGFDTSQIAAVTQALLDRGFAPADIAKIMGGNVLRVIRAGIVPRPIEQTASAR